MHNPSAPTYWTTMRLHGALVLIGSIVAKVTLTAIALEQPILTTVITFFNVLGAAMMFVGGNVTSTPTRVAKATFWSGVAALIMSLVVRYITSESRLWEAVAISMPSVAAALLVLAAMIGLEGRADRTASPHRCTEDRLNY